MRRSSSCCLVVGCDEEDLEKVAHETILTLAKLENADLSERDLRQIDFRGACLVGANLSNSQLTPSLLYGADLRRCKGAEEYGDIWNCPGRVTTVSVPTDKSTNLVLYEWLKSEDIQVIFSKADEGDIFYQFVAGFYLETLGTEEDDKHRAFSLYAQSAAQDYWPAINNLGWMYENGYGVTKSLAEAILCYKRAAMCDVIASFNYIRISAIYDKDNDACYQLGGIYRNGISVPIDMELSFYWTKIAADAGHVKACRFIGVMFRSGTGTDKDFEKSCEYLRRAADPLEDRSCIQGDPDAMFELGVMYESGLGVSRDYTQSRFWYHKAAMIIDHADAFIHLGKLYEEGNGGPVSYEDALLCYKNAALQGRVTGKYNQGRMLEHFPSEENALMAVQLFNEVLGQDPFHTGAKFLLATHYQRGTGVAKDTKKAEKLYFQTAADGHSLAKLRSFLLKYQGDVADTEINQHIDLFDEIAQRTSRAEERIQKEILHDKDSYDDIIQLEDQFTKTMEYYQEFKAQNEGRKGKGKGAYMNPFFLPYDPYLSDISLLEPVKDRHASNSKVRKLFKSIKEAGQSNPALTRKTVSKLVRVQRSINANIELQKRFVRLYNAWMSEEKGIPVPEGIEDRDLYRKSKIAEKLAQNIGRCCDGINNFFSEEEMGFSLNPAIQEIPIGLRISIALMQYKKEFLNLHKRPGYHEENTESLACAFQQLRIPLGLPGVKTSVRYSILGHCGDTFEFKLLIKRFLYGGEIWDSVDVPAYSVENVCSFLDSIIDDPENEVLNKNHISDFVLKDHVLKKAGEDAFINFEENEYCNPFADQNANPYKHKTLERILALHGYVTNHNPHHSG